jgi:hypothetical protein
MRTLTNSDPRENFIKTTPQATEGVFGFARGVDAAKPLMTNVDHIGARMRSVQAGENLEVRIEVRRLRSWLSPSVALP